MIFQFKRGSYMKGDPQAVGERLTAIRELRGDLTPYDVVQEARSASSILHQYFEWNDEAAAEEYRKNQARQLIRSIVLVEHDGQELSTPIRAFVNIQDDASNSYEPIVSVMEDDELREKVLAKLQETLDSHKEKLEAFEEFSDVVHGIEIVQETIGKHQKQTGHESRMAG